ncbi:MAG: hypothetical protein WCJ60_01675 [bacterium]
MYTFNPNEIIPSAKLNANFTEAVGSAWTAYTPTLTNITLNNGTVTGAYIQQGKTVHFKIKLTHGTTTVAGTGTLFTLPVTASSVIYTANVTGGSNLGLATAEDVGNAVYLGTASLVSSTTVGAYFMNASGTYVTLAKQTSSIPFAWGSTDTLLLTGVYEAI